jgi:polyhydroxyalkanoate synthesis regulator phasin
LDKFDSLKEFADAVKNGDAKIDKIPLLSMKASKIYDDADKQTQDCINLAAKIGKTLVSKEVVHCVDDVNFYKNQISNSSVPTTATSTTTSTSADNGTDGTTTSDVKSTSSSGDVKSTSSSGDVKSTSSSGDVKSTSSSGDVKSTSSSGDVKSTSGDVKENNMINELVSTGKFTEAEAKDFVSKTMQNGADGGSISDSPKTSNADTSTSNAQATDNTQSTGSQDNNNANTQSTGSQDNNNANTQSTGSQDNNNANTQSTGSQDNKQSG